MRRIIVMLCLALCLTAALTGTAAAHAGLTSSSPAAGEVLPDRPAQVALTFGEPVIADGDAIRVYDNRMRRVDLGGHLGAEPRRTVRVALPGSLREGTFFVAWRVTSADGHPKADTFRFSIGSTSRVVGAVPSPGGSDDTWSGPLLDAARGLGYAGLALGPGVLLVVLWLWPAGLRDRRTRALLGGGLGLLGVSTLAVLAADALGTHGHPSTVAGSATGSTERAALAGYAHTVRFYGLLALGAATCLLTALGRVTKPLALGTTAVVTVLLGTWPLTGHSVTGRFAPLGVVADLAHLAAMTMWLGGLALAAAVLTRPTTPAELAAVLPRFSRLAFTSVVVLVVTGTFQSWRAELSVGALVDTPYGRLLLLKLVAVAVVVALGGLTRRWVHRQVPSPASVPDAPHGAGGTTLVRTSVATRAVPDADRVRVLRRTLVTELLVGACVLAVTTAMVVTSLPQ
ncbi:copper resistance CopC/CopD family protein [Streptomyces acidicola]|uniref:copper resistance CopC/CopD family protein n=1 Tax=Streptomyces acidicola TaxID=2596892 RepID=UPI0038080282